jgi:hypothetical protein
VLRVALIFAVAGGSPEIQVNHLDAAKDFVDYATYGLRTGRNGRA